MINVHPISDEHRALLIARTNSVDWLGKPSTMLILALDARLTAVENERLASESLIAVAEDRAEKAEKECARLRESISGLVEVLDRTIAPNGDGPVVISSHNDELIEMLCSRIKNVRAAISGAGEPGAVPK